MAIFLVILAGACVALSNLFMRKSIDHGGTTKGFLLFQMLASVAIAILLEPVRTGNFAWNLPVAALGCSAGLILAFLLIFLGKALENGPPGLTFSILSSSTVMPGIFMACVFGASLGFAYTSWHAIGSLFVLAGIFWAGKGASGLQNLKQWVLFCAIIFFLHTALLVLFQWRALLMNVPNPEAIARFFTPEKLKSGWFLPCMFLASTAVQLCVFCATETRLPKFKDFLYGIIGGSANGTGTFFLICAAKSATALENAIIYPIYSVAIIALSNLWGQRLYQERVNWRACQIAAIGLLIATVNWKGVSAAIGF